MKTKFSLLFSFLFISLIAQDYRFGKVSKEEIQKSTSSLEPDAPGEVLFEKINLSIAFNDVEGRLYLTKEVEGRIKVYDKDKIDEDHLKMEVRLYSPSSTREKLGNFRGSTYNLEGDKIVETKVKNSDIFKERKNKYWEVEKFAYSNVKNGSVLEYKYTIVSPFYREIDRWFFQKDIPVLHSEYSFLRPEFMVYSPDERGGLRPRVKQSKKPAFNYNYQNLITEYQLENVKSLQKEPYVFNPNNLKSSLRYELSKLEYPGFITENYTTTWAQIGKDLMNYSDFGGQLKGNGFLDETVQSLVSTTATPLENTQAIFDHVKNNYVWNNFYSLYTDAGIRSTFKDKTGNAADLNLMLVAMLRKAGLNANPVALSTVQNLIVNYTFPSLTSLDFVIASVEINNQLYLMDATEKYSNINMLPLRDLNHRGFRIFENGSIQEIPLTNYSLSTEKEMIGATLSTDGLISGIFSQTKDQYFAMTDKMSQIEDPKEFDKNYLKDFNFDVSDFKKDENAEKGLLRYTFKFSEIPGGDVVGNKIIINPLLFRQLTENVFNQDTRNYPLEFGSLISKSRTVKIKIPEGYKVESLPSDKSFVVQGNVAGYVYKIQEQDGHIILNTAYEIGHSILPAEYYKLMKDFESQQIATESQQVVLTKI